jgi:hypothetical protein
MLDNGRSALLMFLVKAVDGVAMIGSRHTFASYFALAVDTILKVLWREGYARGPQELVGLTYNRIRRLERRFSTLVAQWRAGTLRAVVSRECPVVSQKITPHPGPLPEREKRAWVPRGRAWVVRQLVPVTGQQCVGMLCLTWEEPEMAEFYAAAPQAGRILRPLAHMIGAPLPAWLKLPKRVRVRKKDTSPRPSPQSGEGAYGDERGEMIVPNRRLAPREQAEDAVRRSEASGKPIDLRKFKPAALGYFLHPPRDGNCPPPEIGYGGRRRPLPKDYRPPPKDWE